MKNIFMAMVLLFTFSSCNKGSSGGSDDPVVYELDERLFEGDGTWGRSYMVGASSNANEELVFTGDEVQFSGYILGGGGVMINPFDKRISLTPTGTDTLIGVNVAVPSETWVWKYSFTGTTLKLCDPQNECFEFQK